MAEPTKYIHRVNVQDDIALDIVLEAQMPAERELATAVAAILESAVDDMDGFDIEVLAASGGRCYPDMKTVQKRDIELLDTAEAEAKSVAGQGKLSEMRSIRSSE